MIRSHPIATAVLLLSLLLPSPAPATELDAVPTTLFQALSLRDVRGFLRARQRLTQFLHLRGAGRPDGHRVQFVTSLRYDIDFAITNGEDRVDSNLHRDTFDLMLGFADWSLPSRALSLRLGRQIDWRAQGLFAFDGLTARVELPFHLALTASAGLRVRDRDWYGTPAMGEELAQEPALAPTYGASVALHDLARASAELGWRRTFDGAVIEERVMAAAWGRPVPGLDLTGLLDVDALQGLVGAARAEARYGILEGLDASLAYDLSRPRFAADSIFTVFDLRDRHAGQLWLVVRPAPGWQAQGGYEYRRYSGGQDWIHEDGGEPRRGPAEAHLARAAGQVRRGRLWARLALEAEWGIDGALGLADLSARVLVIEDLLTLGGRAAARLYGGLTTAALAEGGAGQAFGFEHAAFTAVVEARLELGRFGHFETAIETSVDEFHEYSIRGVGLLTLEFEL